MRAVVQRVASASVVVEEKTIGSIGQGYLILLGVGEGDTRETAQKLWAKIRDLRIMPDDAGKTNRSLAAAGAPGLANELYEYFCELVRADMGDVQTGSFGADMSVSLVNDGPFTIVLDTDEL